MKNADRHSIIPAVWMVLRNSKNQVFLLRRFNTGWRDGWWTVPSGHVDVNEGPQAAAIRELKEEVGVDIAVEQLGDPLVYFYPADDQLHERVSVFFEIAADNLTPSNAEPAKADRGEWFSYDALPENMVPLLKRALIDLNDGVRYSERYYDKSNHDELLQ